MSDWSAAGSAPGLLLNYSISERLMIEFSPGQAEAMMLTITSRMYPASFEKLRPTSSFLVGNEPRRDYLLCAAIPERFPQMENCNSLPKATKQTK